MLPLWESTATRKPAVVTHLLIAANLGVFLYEVWLILQHNGTIDSFTARYAVVPQRLLGGLSRGDEWLTLLTCLFLHGSWAHLLFNNWFLWVFGRSVEGRLGGGLFLVLYLLSGLAATVLHIATAFRSDHLLVGASGAISGVMGAYLILARGAWIVALVPWVIPVLPLPGFLFLVVWFGVQVLSGLGLLGAAGSGDANIAWWAHAGGFLAGWWLARTAKQAGWVGRG